MTTWIIENKNKNYLINRQVENGTKDCLGNAGNSLHAALANIGEYLEAGDIVITPEGSTIVGKKQEGMN